MNKVYPFIWFSKIRNSKYEIPGPDLIYEFGDAIPDAIKLCYPLVNWSKSHQGGPRQYQMSKNSNVQNPYVHIAYV